MNGWLLSAGLLALFTALVHTFAGEKDVVRPFKATNTDLTIKKTLHAVWHLVTVFLFLSAFTLLWASYQPMKELVIFIGLNYLLFAAVFLIISLATPWQHRLFRLPQWILLLSVSLLCFMGI